MHNSVTHESECTKVLDAQPSYSTPMVKLNMIHGYFKKIIVRKFKKGKGKINQLWNMRQIV